MGALGLKGLGLLLAFLRVLGFWGFGVKGLGVLGLKGLGFSKFWGSWVLRFGELLMKESVVAD